MLCLYQNMFDFKAVDNKAKGLVVVTQTLKLSTKLHINYSIFNTLKQKYVLDIAQVGRTSFSFLTRLFDAEKGELLAELMLKYVLIDRSTRRPTPLPDTFLQKYKDLKPAVVSPMDLTIKAFPPLEDVDRKVFKMKALPLHSDTDRNNHVNQSVYLRYCCDCATEAALKGVYRRFTSDICWYPVEEISLHHVNESLVNQELIVSTWQDSFNFQLIHFLIYNNNKLLLKASFIFHPEKSTTRPNSRY